MRKKISANTVVGVIVVIALFAFAFSAHGFAFIKNIFDDCFKLNDLPVKLSELSFNGAIALFLLCLVHAIFVALPAYIVPFLSASAYGFWYGVLICIAGFLLGNSVLYFLNKKLNFCNQVTYFDCDKVKRCKNSKILLILAILNPGIPYYEVSRYLTAKNYFEYIIKITLLALPQVLVYALIGALLIDFSVVLWLVAFAVLTVFAIIFRIMREQFVRVYSETLIKKGIQHTSDTTVKKQNSVLYFIFYRVLKLFVKMKVDFSADLQDEIKGPAIVLCSHGSFTDFLYCAMIMGKQYPFFIVARMYFYHSKLAWLIRKLGCFPKSMFSTDLENVKNCMRVLQDGGILNMMPEARLSTVGKFEGIQPTTYKFIKKMGVNVYGIKINGSFLSNPKWGDGIRTKSRVEAKLSLIASKEEIAEINEEQLKQRIINNISYDDFKWLESKPEVRYKSKTLAEGLENVLFICPHCKSQFTIQTKGRSVFCTHCGFKRELNDRYCFTDEKPFKNFAEWYDYQRQIVKQEIESSENYCYSDNVILKHQSYDGKTLLREAGAGVCTLTKEGLTYVGSDDGVQVEKFYKLSVVYRILFGAGENFEIYDGKQIYYFVPEDTRTCVKWYILSGLLSDIK